MKIESLPTKQLIFFIKSGLLFTSITVLASVILSQNCFYNASLTYGIFLPSSFVFMAIFEVSNHKKKLSGIEATKKNKYNIKKSTKSHISTVFYSPILPHVINPRAHVINPQTSLIDPRAHIINPRASAKNNLVQKTSESQKNTPPENQEAPIVEIFQEEQARAIRDNFKDLPWVFKGFGNTRLIIKFYTKSGKNLALIQKVKQEGGVLSDPEGRWINFHELTKGISLWSFYQWQSWTRDGGKKDFEYGVYKDPRSGRNYSIESLMEKGVTTVLLEECLTERIHKIVFGKETIVVSEIYPDKTIMRLLVNPCVKDPHENEVLPLSIATPEEIQKHIIVTVCGDNLTFQTNIPWTAHYTTKYFIPSRIFYLTSPKVIIIEGIHRKFLKSGLLKEEKMWLISFEIHNDISFYFAKSFDFFVVTRRKELSKFGIGIKKGQIKVNKNIPETISMSEMRIFLSNFFPQINHCPLIPPLREVVAQYILGDKS